MVLQYEQPAQFLIIFSDSLVSIILEISFLASSAGNCRKGHSEKQVLQRLQFSSLNIFLSSKIGDLREIPIFWLIPLFFDLKFLCTRG